jgi:tetratricopeptide (TPR) repeat protein
VATTQPEARAIPEEINAISEELQGSDAAAVTQAVTQMHQLLQANTQKGGGVIRAVWVKRLQELQRYDDVLDLSLAAILASPADTANVEQLQSDRVQALLAAGRASEALVAARQLFNVSTLKGTADAIRTVCQCLNAVHPDDRNVLKRYRREQIEGAGPEFSSASTGPSSLSSVQIDPKPFEAAIRQITAEDYRSLTGEGNLMLLAGRANDAREVFERAYTLASDKDLAAASENLARCMKAQDGTIGRANAWVLSIRPRGQTASEHAMAGEVAATQASAKE